MMTERRQERLRTIIQRSRARLMVDNPGFALILMYLRYVATKQVFRMSTNGKVIYFDPDWIQKLSGKEMDYILSHQVLHLVREDVKRPAFFAGERYHHACDIILNSFMRELGLNGEHFPHIGDLPHKTYYPEYEGSILTPIEAFRAVPFDPSTLKPGQRRFFRIDSDEWWDRFGMPEDGTLILYPGYKKLSDEVVRDKDENGPILHVKYSIYSPSFASLSAGGSDELAEYENQKLGEIRHDTDQSIDDNLLQDEIKQKNPEKLDEDPGIDELDNAIDRLVHMIENMDAAASKHAQTMERAFHSVASAKLEWRKLLNVFLQEEVHDYSFQPPDRRFNDSGFFLPDFNERDESIQNILFMIDSSASVNDEMISLVYGEITAAIEQFNGKMTGSLGFFNTNVTPPIPFCTTRELLRIRPRGSGGTDFGCIFRYVQEHAELVPSCIVVFTDGIGQYPREDAAAGIPVLWILYGDAAFPNWGRTARL